MEYLAVEHLDVDRLLVEWRWLCPLPVKLVARSAFGDLFLEDETGKILRLDVHGGELREIAVNRQIFEEGMQHPALKQSWFSLAGECNAAQTGLVPGPYQCITFAIPIIFKGSGYAGNAYLGAMYEAVSFLGDLHRQISNVPDGAQVRLSVKEQTRRDLPK